MISKEFSELSRIPGEDSEKMLDKMVSKGYLEKVMTKNGSILG